MFLTFGYGLYAQTEYKKGFYINDFGNKVDGYIKYEDWKYTPTTFEYRETPSSSTKIIAIDDAKLFAFDNFKEYERFTVKLDTSATKLKDLDFERNPLFKEKTIYLEKLTDGNAKLYVYSSSKTNNKYFYSKGSGTPQQLVFKEYMVSKNGNTPKLAVNEYYKQQILNSLDCETITTRKVTGLDYKERNLKKIFEDYNSCKDENYTTYYDKDNHKKDAFALSIRPGVTYSTVDFTFLQSIGVDRSASLDYELGYKIGVELEYTLPFNNNKWSLILEPLYTHYKSQTFVKNTLDSDYFTNNENVNVEYNSFGAQAGIRYYFFLNEESSIFINARYYQQFFVPSSSFAFERSRDYTFYESTNSISFGAGYNYNRKFSVELNYVPARALISNYNYTAKLREVSLTLGYNFL
ncbi:porin family protein [Haloflavibacter putidus]|uniref:Porin family protein n=1 Tax=Haloflavibacter putidus TaxID=2576776 RepID=A0A507ZQU9_9FLAO|nr:porin family protein [Haloflavibacter putidus]TQD40146.1 porin family protein [Haloflavibacter putidus]